MVQRPQIDTYAFSPRAYPMLSQQLENIDKKQNSFLDNVHRFKEIYDAKGQERDRTT